MEKTPLSHKLRLTNAFFEAFEDTPIFNASILALHQLLGWPAYMMFGAFSILRCFILNFYLFRYNASGRLEYPTWGTSHLNPFAALFKSGQREILS